jgi:hypothetical protein
MARKATVEQMTQTLSQPGDWYPKGYTVTSVYYPGEDEPEVTVRRREATGAVSAEPLLVSVAPRAAAEWLHANGIRIYPQAG